jgi:hypothetical protein
MTKKIIGPVLSLILGKGNEKENHDCMETLTLNDRISR